MAERKRAGGSSRGRPSRSARRGGGGRRPTAQHRRRRWLLILALGVGLGAFALSRVDFDEAIRDLTLPLEHEEVIREQAREKDVPADLIAAVINAESGFEDQTSPAGARGLMQITPDTADVIENLSGGLTFETEDLADPEINIRYGTFYLRHLLDRFDQNVVAALAAYNAGPTNADRWGGSSLTQEDIEFPETSAYVEKVLDKRKDYRRSYRRELGL